MSTGILAPSATAGLPVPADPARAVGRLAMRQVRRGGLLVVALAGGMTALVAATYGQVMADPAAAGSLEALAANPAIRLLFGEPNGLGSAGGFTVWRVGTVTAVLLGAWAVLATTRITRGEEDTGRWDLLLAGRIPLRQAVLRHLGAVMIVPGTTGAAITGVLLAAGTAVPGALVHGAGTALLGLFFAGTAALTAQLFPSRSPATATAIAVLGAGLLARMIGDGITGLGWLRWLSPFGLLALSGPFVHDRLVPLLLLLAATAGVTAAALLAAGRREVRGGLLGASSGRRARLGWLGNVEGFAARRAWPTLTGWTLGVGAYYLLIGLTAESVTGFLADNPALAAEAADAGFAGLGSIAGFTATLFTILAMPVSGFTAARMGAFVTAETDRRMMPLAAQPLTRARLLGAEITATTAGAAVLVTAAALATWTGVTAIGGDLTLAAALGGAWNAMPIVLLSLAAAVFAIGWAPGWVHLLGGLPATGGFLLLVIAETVAAPTWVRDLSPFAHLAPVPLTAANWTATAVMSASAAILLIAGLAGYRRRDLRS
jgi:ABC-2 type transport system permease protein